MAFLLPMVLCNLIAITLNGMRRGFPQLARMWMALLLPMVLRNLLAITLNGMRRGFPQLEWMWMAHSAQRQKGAGGD